MTELEIAIEEHYQGFILEFYPKKPTHFIFSPETYKQLRKEFNRGSFYDDFINKDTARGLPYLIDNTKKDHYIATALISTYKNKVR